MPDSIALAVTNNPPDYPELVKFLMQPLLESPSSLKIYCEQSNNSQRVWIRLAFEGADKGRVFGRGGRNIQAIRTVLDTAAKMAGQSVYLDIYETPDPTQHRRENDSGERQERKKGRGDRRSTPKFSAKPHS